MFLSDGLMDSMLTPPTIESINGRYQAKLGCVSIFDPIVSPRSITDNALLLRSTAVFFPAMLVDKLLYLEQSLINHTAEVGVYVLLLEDTQFDPPIYPLVRVILMVCTISFRF